MNLNRTRNAGRNLFWGIGNNALKMTLAFVIRTVIIYNLGIEYQGLNSLFTSILSVLSVAELGFDTATVTVMYNSIAKNNINELCALLRFIKIAYLIVGSVILISGLICVPLLPYLIKDFSSIPDGINAYHIFLVFLLNSVVSYFFGGYSSSIISAYQRQDLLSRANSITTTVFYILEIVTLFLFHNYYLYIYMIVAGSIGYNLLVFFISRKRYRNIKPFGRVNVENRAKLKKMIIGMVYGKIGGTLSTSFDNMVISSFLGIGVLAYFSNYSYIISVIQSFMMLAYTAIQAGVGNSLVLESIEKNYNDMLVLTFIYDWLVGWSSICLLYLFTPFITMWIGEVGVLPNILLVIIVLNFYISKCTGIIGTYKNALGIWWEDRYRGMIGGVVNLAINLLMAFLLQKYGQFAVLSGVMISTIISNLVILIPWAVCITFKNYFISGLKKYIKCIVIDFAITIVIISVCYPIMTIISKYFHYDSIFCLLLRFLCCIIFPNILWLALNHKRPVFISAKVFLIDHVSQFAIQKKD